MNGEVGLTGRALIIVTVRAGSSPNGADLPVWIDTAFTGDLAMPRRIIRQLNLTSFSAVTAGLADGSEVLLDAYTCAASWFGTDRTVEVIECDGLLTLLGIGLLCERRLEIDYRSSTVTIE
jgi:clan AA aspartic protease